VGPMQPGKHFWHVRARNASEQESDWSETWSFFIPSSRQQPSLPPPPVLSSPGNNSTWTQSTDVTLIWSTSSNATQYKVELNGQTRCDWQSGTTCYIGPLQTGTYSWHVKARDASEQESDWSETWAFLIQGSQQPSIPSPPVLSSPGNNSSSTQNTAVTLIWNATSNATQYKVELWGGPYSSMTRCNWQGSTSCHIGQMLSGTYSWRVKARNASGQESPWSNTWSFTIQEIVVTTTPPSCLEPVVLVDNLSLRTDGSGQWPPRLGDKLVAHIKVRNNCGETLHLTQIGVRGRRNVNENWDIGWWPKDLAPGEVWEFDPNNQHQVQAGSYSFRISYQDGSGWHEIGNEVNFTVNSEPCLEPVVLVDNLSLRTDGSGQWPPRLGDKLVAHIKVRNNCGQTLHLTHIGVRGRRNVNENWDIGWWPKDLAPGEVWEFDPNNERQVQVGNYSFRISYQDGSGWHEIGNEVNFTVNSEPCLEPVVLVDNLSLRTDGSGQWPPRLGDKLVAHIKVRNNCGETLHLTQIGVRGRRNVNENWDIGWWPKDLAPGEVWEFDPNNERQVQAGSYSFRISYQDGSGWHEIGNEVNFSVDSGPCLEPVVLVDNLSLRTDGSGQWPPRLGDKLVAHIKVRNNCGQTLHLTHIGVRGRRNVNENWDIGWWPKDLAPGEVWEFNPNNERQVQAGSYSFRISYQDGSGWHEIGNEVNFTAR
jgi:hypothetical protein